MILYGLELNFSLHCSIFACLGPLLPKVCNLSEGYVLMRQVQVREWRPKWIVTCLTGKLMYLSLHECMAFRILNICKAYCVIRIILLLIISEANNKHVFRNAKLRHRAWQSSTRAAVDMVAFVHMSFTRTCSITVPSYGLPEDPSWEITRAVCVIPKIHLKVKIV